MATGALLSSKPSENLQQAVRRAHRIYALDCTSPPGAELSCREYNTTRKVQPHALLVQQMQVLVPCMDSGIWHQDLHPQGELGM